MAADGEVGVGGRDCAPRRPRRRLLRAFGIGGILTLATFVAVTAHLLVWPDLEPAPERVNAIVELGGPGDSDRDRVALKLARNHRAPVLIQSTVVGDAHCLPPAGGARVICFHPDPNTTRGEARWLGAIAAQRHWKSVIVVTTPDQAWRANLRVARCFRGTVYNVTAHLPFLDWLRQIPYQWVASAKALTIERTC